MAEKNCRFLVGCFAVCAFFVLATPAGADASAPAQSPNDSPSDNIVARGKAVFTVRQTIVRQTTCTQEGPCTRAQDYWALLLEGDRDGQPVQYEINHVFARGQEKAPGQVVLGNAVIEPGSEVTLKGESDEVEPNYFLVSNVSDVQVSDGSSGSDEGQAEERLPTYYGWTCRSAQPDSSHQGVELQADVWYASRPSQAPLYRIHVTASTEDGSGRDLHDVAVIDNATQAVQGSDVIYAGGTDQGDAQLRIKRQSGDYRNVPSLLSLSRVYSNLVTRVPLDSSFEMVCNLTR